MPSLPLLTRHAALRSRTRRIPTAAIEAVMTYGLLRLDRGAEIYTLGWRQVRYWAEQGVDLSRLDGIEVVCAHGGQVVTVYRNRKPSKVRDRGLRNAA